MKATLKCPHCGDRTSVPDEPSSIGGTFNCERCGKLFYVNTERQPDGTAKMVAEEPR